MPAFAYLFGFVFLFFCKGAFCQQTDSASNSDLKNEDSIYIIRLDTLVHVQTWISANQMEYKLFYDKDFKLVLAPNKTNNLSLGFSYRYLELGLSFSPHFLNANQDDNKKGQSEQVSFKTGFSIHRFNLNFDLTSVKGFYLKNSGDFVNSRGLPDSPYFVFPNLTIGYFSVLLRYNANPKFSTAALTGGTQVQKQSAISILPTFQLATYKFHDGSKNTSVQNEFTYSTDLNLIVPIAGTLVLSPKFSASLAAGPSFGVDFFRSVSIDDSSKLLLSKGTKFTAGYSLQTAVSYNAKRFYGGVEFRSRSYGHEIEDVSRLIKQYSYFQVYVGWRLRAPRFAKKALDWVNKISPVDFD